MKLLTTYQKKKTIDIVSSVEGSVSVIDSSGKYISLEYVNEYEGPDDYYYYNYNMTINVDNIIINNVSEIKIPSSYNDISTGRAFMYENITSYVYYPEIIKASPNETYYLFNNEVINHFIDERYNNYTYNFSVQY